MKNNSGRRTDLRRPNCVRKITEATDPTWDIIDVLESFLTGKIS